MKTRSVVCDDTPSTCFGLSEYEKCIDVYVMEAAKRIALHSQNMFIFPSTYDESSVPCFPRHKPICTLKAALVAVLPQKPT